MLSFTCVRTTAYDDVDSFTTYIACIISIHTACTHTLHPHTGHTNCTHINCTHAHNNNPTQRHTHTHSLTHPHTLTTHYPSANVTRSPDWGGFTDKYCCDYLLAPEDPLFAKIGDTLMETQAEEYGNLTSSYYNCDMYNEMQPADPSVEYVCVRVHV